MDVLTVLGGLALISEAGKCVRSCFVHLPSQFTGKRVRTTLIVPFKGLEPGLEDHARAFAAQKATETFFVVDSKKDPAYPILARIRGVRIIIAGEPRGASGKCSALLAGVKRAHGDVFVFGDSDSLAGKGFLDALTLPLTSEEVGATTGYRWYVPSPHNLASLAKSAWDETGLNLQLSQHAFVWGGSYAVRRRDFYEWKLDRAWMTAISDDTAVTAAVKRVGKRILFTPGAMVESTAQTSWRDLVEFTNRQVFMVRNFAREGWMAGLLVYGWTFLSTIFCAVSFATGNIFAGILFLASFTGPSFRSIALRRIYHPLVHHRTYAPAIFGFFARLLMFSNLLHASFAKEITWRGRQYRLSDQSQ